MRMIGCVSRPTGGHAAHPRPRPGPRRPGDPGRLGVCPQQDTLDPELTVRQNLTVYARYFGIPRRVGPRAKADELLDFVQLTERANARSSRCPAA